MHKVVSGVKKVAGFVKKHVKKVAGFVKKHVKKVAGFVKKHVKKAGHFIKKHVKRIFGKKEEPKKPAVPPTPISVDLPPYPKGDFSPKPLQKIPAYHSSWDEVTQQQARAYQTQVGQLDERMGSVISVNQMPGDYVKLVKDGIVPEPSRGLIGESEPDHMYEKMLQEHPERRDKTSTVKVVYIGETDRPGNVEDEEKYDEELHRKARLEKKETRVSDHEEGIEMGDDGRTAVLSADVKDMLEKRGKELLPGEPHVEIKNNGFMTPFFGHF